jgi:two-component system invasion response regulator UvrY
MGARIRVMLTDDHAVVRMGFRLVLDATADIEVVGEVESGEEACRRYDEVRPDVVVMDLAMPGMGGIETTTRILARDPKAKILALSAHDDISHPRRMLQAGALGYLSKRSAPETLIVAVRELAAGRRYLDASLAQRMALAQAAGAQNPFDLLTEREFEVFMQLARGQSVNHIAEALRLSPSTVGTHLYNVKKKLNASNQAELTLIAIRNGLLLET